MCLCSRRTTFMGKATQQQHVVFSLCSLLKELMCLHLLYLGILHIIQIYQFINFHMGFVSQLKYGLLDSILLLPSLLLFLNSNWFQTVEMRGCLRSTHLEYTGSYCPLWLHFPHNQRWKAVTFTQVLLYFCTTELQNII